MPDGYKREYSLRYLISILLLLPVLVHAKPVPDFDAWYTTTKYGLNAAKTHTSYRYNPSDSSYSYTSTSKASGVVSIFRSDIITESSAGHLVKGHYRPERYSFIHKKGSKVKKLFRLKFLWDKQQVIGSYRGVSKSDKLTAGAIDRFILQVAIMKALQEKPKALTYTIADKHKVKQWTFKVSGKEKIKTDAGTFETIKLVRQHGSKNRTTYLYCAPSLQYLPVRIMFVERDGGKFTMNLNKSTGLK